MKSKHLTLSLIFATMLILQGLTIPVAASEQKLSMGIVPQQSATRLARAWVPFLTELSKLTGVKISFATAKDIPSYEECLAAGAYDLAYMNPYHYTEFSADPGYIAFAHQRGKRLKGILVTRKDSSIMDLRDLADADIAFPSPAAFGASVLPRAEINKLGIQIQPQYVKSHDSVYRAVAAGLYPAGGGVLRTFGRITKDLRSQLRVFYETAAYTPHAFAAHPRVDPSLVETIVGQMVAMDANSPSIQALGMKGIDAGNDASWNDVRDLGLTGYQTQIHKADDKCLSD